MIIFCAVATAAGLCAPKTDDKETSTAVASDKEVPLVDDNYSYQDHLRLYAHRKYGALMALLQGRLSRKDYTRLQELLEARELAVNGRNRPAGSLDDLPETRMGFELQIRTELGDETANTVTDFIQSIPARGILARVNLLLSYRGDPLKPEQMEVLCHLMAKHATPIPRNVKTATEIRSFTEHRLARDRLIMASARNDLSPVQVEALSGEMEFQVSAIKMGMLNAIARK